MSDDNTQDGAEPSPASAGSHVMGVPLLLDAIGDCLAQVDPFDQRCVVVLNTPERRKAHKALWQLRQMAESSYVRLLPEEREAVGRMSFLLEQHGWREDAAVFRGLLRRLR